MKNRNGKPALREREVVVYTSVCFWQGEIHTHTHTGLLAQLRQFPNSKPPVQSLVTLHEIRGERQSPITVPQTSVRQHIITSSVSNPELGCLLSEQVNVSSFTPMELKFLYNNKRDYIYLYMLSVLTPYGLISEEI
jgi:hypothetical protein